MPENEFEKKVASEMQELKFKPSAHVWMQVEEKIRKKRKRRVFIFLFFLAGLGLLGYWQWNNMFGNKETGIAKTTTNNTEIKPSTGEQPAPNKPVTTDAVNDKKESLSTNKLKEQAKTGDNIDQPAEVERNQNNQGVRIDQPRKKETVVANNTGKKSTDRKTPVIKNETGGSEINSDQAVVTKDRKDVARPELPGKEPILKDNRVADGKEVAKNTDATKISRIDSTAKSSAEPLIIKTDSLYNKEEKKNDAIIDSIKKKAGPSKDSIVRKKDHAVKKWKWGFELTPGISSLSEEVFSFDLRKMADAYASPNTGSGGPPQQRTPPSANSTGSAFQLGVFAKNQFTKRSSLSLGLRYGYYGDRIRVGSYSAISSSTSYSNSQFREAGFFYSAANSYHDRKNSYHFIELPASYQLRLNKNAQKPFEWNIGFTVSRLIASNAVMYDTAFGGIYYKNKEQLNNGQFGLSTGLSWTILQTKGIQWSLGPVADIHINSLLDNPFEKKKYLVFAGLRSAVLFNSKK